MKPVLELLKRVGILQYFSKVIPKETVIFTPETWAWCKRPYKKRPNGCPNFSCGLNCPPQVKYQGEKVAGFSHFRLVWVQFAFKQFKELRKLQNPNLKDGMAGNMNQWQSAVKKRLYKHIRVHFHHLYIYILGCGSGFGSGIQSCESAGMNVYETCRLNDIPINAIKDIQDYSADIRFFALLMS
jgi:predicted metal-binding protein